ncbi:MAG: hypothetical protein H0V40_11855 [Actinobacteria bacterium]|nr:hypothetical protein [Actinomycetota bacterium]
MSPSLPLAHELWFVHDPPPGDWSFLVEPLTLAYLAGALALVALVRALAHVRDGVDVPRLARLAPWLPFAIRLHVGVSLIGLLSGGTYLAPSLALPHSLAGWLLGLLAAVTAVSLIAGYRARAAAALLIASGPIGMLVFGVWPIVQRVDLLGLAAFLLITGPGRWSADEERGATDEPTVLKLGRAVWALRVCVGSALIAVALAEKLANPALAQRFLEAQSVQLNVLQALGMPVGDLEFVRIAGAVEVLFGLLLISGALPQAIVLAAGIPFNLTLYFFGTIELLGHLPVYGAMLVLLVFGSHPELRPYCGRLLPPRGSSLERSPIAPAASVGAGGVS